MHFFKITLVLVISLVLLTSCSEVYEEYGFKSIENDFSWGVVGAKLIGNEKYYRNTAIRSSPYELFIWFGSDTFMEGTIYISELKLINTETKMVVFKQDNIVEEPIQKYTNSYRAYFSFEDIKLEYVDMILQMKFTLKQAEKTTEYETEIYFEKNYRKFRRIIGV
jgi:hypothetical protein